MVIWGGEGLGKEMHSRMEHFYEPMILGSLVLVLVP